MNFELSENQSLFKAAVERFCSPGDVAARKAARGRHGALDRARWAGLAELGLIAVAASEADGGLDGSLLDCTVIARTLGAGLAVEPWLECGFLAARLMKNDARLAAVLTGESIATLAFAEPGRRFVLDARSVVSEGGKLTGEKSFVPCGAAADIFLVTAQHRGRTAVFAVPSDAAGVTVRPYPVADGSLAAQVSLRGVESGKPLEGDLEATVDAARILAAAEMSGVAQRLFDETLAYVKTREQFGQPIGRFQVIQHRMVDVYAKVEAAQSALWGAVLQPSAPFDAVKAFVAEEALWVAEQAVQLHGGMGITDELVIGHGLKRILYLSKLFGDPSSAIAAYARAA